ncbi:AI-2E family transporter [candidate division WWE3 bacterium]|jgi:predicted PurR-regulated permease PerM|nr:AI-2E family transporter [candidate division WWE3 bacterium]MBT7350399.1 AI-2E family transporter [candidate division WWE3 bacterium]
MDKTVANTIKAVLTTVVILLAIWILYTLAPIFATIFVALFVVLSLEPAVKYFEGLHILNKKVNRNFAVALTFTLFVLSVIFILTIGLPPVLSQAQKLLANMADFVGGIPGLSSIEVTLQDFLPKASGISEGVVDVTFSVFSNMFAVLSVLFLSLYMSLDWENIKKHFKSWFTGENKSMVGDLINEIEVNIGHWVKGQLLLMVIVGLAGFFGLLILGVDYPLALGLVSGLLEIVPVLGPVLSAVLAAVVGFAASPVKGFGAVILFLIIQQVENNFLVPRVMQKVSGFSPLVILIALLIGSKLFGLIGAVIAVPLMMILVLVVRKLLRYNS